MIAFIYLNFHKVFVFHGLILFYGSLFMICINEAGYQFDYVFDWTILKYPQVGSSTRSRVNIHFDIFINQSILWH